MSSAGHPKPRTARCPITTPINVYRLDQIREAHADMEHNRTVGKLVVRLSDSD